jgi:hypothetical protein
LKGAVSPANVERWFVEWDQGRLKINRITLNILNTLNAKNVINFFIYKRVSELEIFQKGGKEIRVKSNGSVSQAYKKVKKGVDFVVTQAGFDVRKFDESLRYMHHHSFPIPILENVYLHNQAVAKVMNCSGVLGCVGTDEFYQIGGLASAI